MSRERLSSIAHADLPFATPWSDPTARDVVEALDLAAGARVVDLGCGWAELLTRIVERYGVAAEGVERSPYALARARESTLPRTRGQLTLHEGDIADVALPAASYDLVVCIGSTHLFGGLAGTLAEAIRLLGPGGRLLLGDGVWTAPPTPAALAALGAEPTDIPTLGEVRGLLRSVGLAATRHWVSSPAEWDHYESSWCAALEEWATAKPDDPDAAAARDLAAEHRHGYADGYRGVLGFVTTLLATPELVLAGGDPAARA